jgi:uncharacterized protein YjeT (DUF2065 family)
MKSALIQYLSGIFLGAVFGAVLFVLVAGGLLPIATPDAAEQLSRFLAGFSERWARDTIVRTLPGTPDTADPRIIDAGQSKDS